VSMLQFLIALYPAECKSAQNRIAPDKTFSRLTLGQYVEIIKVLNDPIGKALNARDPSRFPERRLFSKRDLANVEDWLAVAIK